ncbi:GPN-loop GTPase 1 [Chamberlinius hualienensis]
MDVDEPQNAASAAIPSSSDQETPDVPSSSLPICLIVLGMAATGKTTFIQRLSAHLQEKETPPYVVNLDPACNDPPFPVNIDIRDTINYKEVMKEFKLGPNGGIITSLNLYTTRFNQVIDLIEKRKNDYKYIIFDTPGQIEIFTWSASGEIISKSLASKFPTIIIYMMDTVKSHNPSTFMSSMLYACGILYKMKLPLIVTMNKVDVAEHQLLTQWMTDNDAFQEALETDSSYRASLTSSMSLVLEEFYETLKTVGVSAASGAGVDDFFQTVTEAVVEYETNYLPEYKRLLKEKEDDYGNKRKQELENLRKDMGEGSEVKETTNSTLQISELGEMCLMSRGLSVDEVDTSDEEYQSPDENIDLPNDNESLLNYLKRKRQEKTKPVV